MDVHLVKGHVTHEFEAHHYHSSDPEEYDVETGYQNLAWVKRFYCIGILWPALGAERPQSGRKPGIKNIIVLAKRNVCAE